MPFLRESYWNCMQSHGNVNVTVHMGMEYVCFRASVPEVLSKLGWWLYRARREANTHLPGRRHSTTCTTVTDERLVHPISPPPAPLNLTTMSTHPLHDKTNTYTHTHTHKQSLIYVFALAKVLTEVHWIKQARSIFSVRSLSSWLPSPGFSDEPYTPIPVRSLHPLFTSFIWLGARTRARAGRSRGRV